MPRYYFHVYGEILLHHTHDADLTDDASAYEEAIQTARAVVSAQAAMGRVHLRDHVEVMNNRRRVVAIVPLSEAVEIEQ